MRKFLPASRLSDSSVAESKINPRNGKTPGITQPSAALQETVIRKAYLKAGLDFADSDYVECHGTGTPVGDLIEVDALSRCFASPARSGPLLIGSVSWHYPRHFSGIFISSTTMNWERLLNRESKVKTRPRP